MTELVNGPLLIDRLKKAFKTSRKASLAVAFWGHGAARRIGIRKGDDVKVVCNLAHGGTNPDEIARLQKCGVKVRHHPFLHAKIGVVGDLSFVGSSNMSANGLGLEGKKTAGWEEANVICSGDPLNVGARFQVLWKDSKRVTDIDLEEARRAWTLNRRTRARQSTGAASALLVDAMRDDVQRLTDANVYVAIHQPPTPEEEDLMDRARDNLHQQFDDSFDVYLGWPDLPKDAYFVSFERGGRSGKSLSYEGLWHRPADIEDKDEGDDSIQVVKRISDICGLSVRPRKDGKSLKEAASACLKHNNVPPDEAEFFSMEQFVPFLPKDHA